MCRVSKGHQRSMKRVTFAFEPGEAAVFVFRVKYRAEHEISCKPRVHTRHTNIHTRNAAPFSRKTPRCTISPIISPRLKCSWWKPVITTFESLPAVRRRGVCVLKYIHIWQAVERKRKKKRGKRTVRSRTRRGIMRERKNRFDVRAGWRALPWCASSRLHLTFIDGKCGEKVERM